MGGLVAGKSVRWMLTGLWEKATKAASEVLPWGFQTTYRTVAIWKIFSPFSHLPAHLSLVSESWGLKRLDFTCFSFLLPQPAWVRPSSRHRCAGSGSPLGGWGSAPPHQRPSPGASPMPSLVIPAPQNVSSTTISSLLLPPLTWFLCHLPL